MALAGLVGYDSDFSSDEDAPSQPTNSIPAHIVQPSFDEAPSKPTEEIPAHIVQPSFDEAPSKPTEEIPSHIVQPTFALNLAPKPAEQPASIFRNRAPSTDEPAPKLNISDEDEPYRRKEPELYKKPTTTPVIDFTLTAPIGQLITQAKVVSVNTDALKVQEGAISNLLPEPKVRNVVLESELKGLQSGVQRKRKKTKKKIFALELEDYTEEEETPKPKKVQPSSGSGLFSLLPEPKHCTGVGSRINVQNVKKRFTPSAPGSGTQFGGLMPRTLPKSKAAPVVIEEADNPEDFFGFEKSVKERSALETKAAGIKLDKYEPKVTAPTVRPVVFRPEGCGGLDSVTGDVTIPQEEQQMNLLEGADGEEIPHEFRDLNSAEIIDVNQSMPSTEDWALKHLDYSDKPTASTKYGGGGQSKKKHQITYLAWQAKEKEAELQNNWANNKVNRHATQNKYGFR